MIESTIMAVAANTVISESVKKGVSDLYDFLKGKSKIAVAKWRAERGVEDLSVHVKSIRNVKTIWQIDRAVDLKEFYVPPHIKVGTERMKVFSVDDIPRGRCVLIEGIAGQGKSMLMRYLCSQELLEGTRIPIFIELRRIRKEECIFDYIARYLEILGLQVDKDSFYEFLKKGKVTIYLDGFDEVNPEVRDRLVGEIESLCVAQRECRLLITSRPFQTIRSLACLDVIQLDKLIKHEYKEVVYKISDNREYADALIKVVESHKQDIKGILCTPLFITLLVISYKSYQQIPDQLSDFYDSLFRVLLQRHDGTKPSYVRPRKTKLNDTKFRDGFEYFCYLSKKHKKQNLTVDEMLTTAECSLKKANIETEADDFISDISDVTCLIISEGDEWRFIHKSIQEYFTASYIRRVPENNAKKIYSELAKKYRQDWIAEIKFLSEIDEYRYAKYFFIPCVKKIVGNSSNFDGEPPKITMSLVKSILGGYKVTFHVGRDRLIKAQVSFDDDISTPLHEIVMLCSSFLLQQITKTKLIEPIKNCVPEVEHVSYESDLNKIMADDRAKKAAFKFTEHIISRLYRKGRNYEIMIKETEQENIDDGLFD
ncbi:NACHT domain-containing protein [Aeromonas sp. 5HA1]|uniref:NACHT domain-containing protein n=1 Tax=Aeromonas sp. 5HA1 TaxID=2699197 RepID=UPI0023DDB914|nr:NACHT domain-containing protein [Aeromonas sp. 5HA1]MDF2403690.1 NACHT domain-containing protein [Aeromonas sp. 5HA1]